ncbi:MAG: TetR/AcrR family transcriptional regulator [Pseudomonadota bacterium]
MSASRTDEILDVAEASIRKGGFDAVSFRDIAAAIGIKSASVHYHFPHKSDLGRAVVSRYGERLFAALGAPDAPGAAPRKRIKRLTQAYRDALAPEGDACLCAVLGAMTQGLPEPVSKEISAFYDRLLGWTKTALKGGKSTMTPEMIVSSLIGAMILAVERGQPKLLADAEKAILAAVAD